MVALRRVVAGARRFRKTLDLLDEAGSMGRSTQVGASTVQLGRTANEIRKMSDGPTRTLGRIAGVVRDVAAPN